MSSSSPSLASLARLMCQLCNTCFVSALLVKPRLWTLSVATIPADRSGWENVSGGLERTEGWWPATWWIAWCLKHATVFFLLYSLEQFNKRVPNTSAGVRRDSWCRRAGRPTWWAACGQHCGHCILSCSTEEQHQVQLGHTSFAKD